MFNLTYHFSILTIVHVRRNKVLRVTVSNLCRPGLPSQSLFSSKSKEVFGEASFFSARKFSKPIFPNSVNTLQMPRSRVLYPTFHFPIDELTYPEISCYCNVSSFSKIGFLTGQFCTDCQLIPNILVEKNFSNFWIHAAIRAKI